MTDTYLASERPENQLILLSARSALAPEVAARIRQLVASELDWAYLEATASAHGVLPLVYRSLDGLGGAGVPPEALRSLRDAYDDNALDALQLARSLLAAVRTLRDAGVDCIAFKGPALAASLYGNTALRQAGDLDLLVPAAAVAQALRALQGGGYTPSPDAPDFEQSETVMRQVATRYSSSWMDGHGVEIELHWRLTQRHFGSNQTLEAAWQRLTVLPFSGEALIQPTPEDLLLLLCIHGSKHMWLRLAWICDIAELIRKHPNLQWGLLEQRATASASELMLLLGLFLARELLGAELPACISASIAGQPRLHALARGLVAHLFQPIGPLPSEPPFTQWFHLQLFRCWRQRLRYLAIWLTIPTQIVTDRLRLPPSLQFLYPPLNLLFVAGYCGLGLGRYGCRLLGTFRR